MQLFAPMFFVFLTALQENKERVENIGISVLGIFELGGEKNERFEVEDTILLVWHR